MIRFKLNAFALPLVAAALVSGVLSSPRVAAAQDEEKKSEVKDLDTQLAKQMEVIDESLKKLRRTLRKPDSNPDSLVLIEKLEKACIASKDLVPAMAEKVPEAERAKWVEAYKKDMDATIKTVGEMKAAVKANNNDKANELYKTLKQQEEKGHEKYTE